MLKNKVSVSFNAVFTKDGLAIVNIFKHTNVI